jgi:cellulose synthase/poly-beta-1,6-N-acetylglucosamine synthase-like glycosyltransferase
MLSESPGTIVLPTTEIGRFTAFTASISSTQQPDGCELSIRASANVTANINNAIECMRDTDEWVWILGDDHVWENDCLMRLLNVMDENPHIDILVPLVVKRSPPWMAVIFHEVDGKEGIPMWQHFNWSEIPPVGLFECDGVGSAGMVIRRSVIDDMGKPWFESSNGEVLNEDLIFCKKARELGYKIYCTSDVTMGHLGIYNVRALFKNGQWGALTEFSTPEDQFRHVYMPV